MCKGERRGRRSSGKTLNNDDYLLFDTEKRRKLFWDRANVPKTTERKINYRLRFTCSFWVLHESCVRTSVFHFWFLLSLLSSSLVRSCGGRCVFSGNILYEIFTTPMVPTADTNWRTHFYRFIRNGQRHENYHNACACIYNQSTLCRHSVETWTRWRDISAKQSINFLLLLWVRFIFFSKFILFYEIYFVCQMKGGEYMSCRPHHIHTTYSFWPFYTQHSTLQTGKRQKNWENGKRALQFILFSVCLFCHQCWSQR